MSRKNDKKNEAQQNVVRHPNSLELMKRNKRPVREGFGQVFDLYLDLAFQRKLQEARTSGADLAPKNFTEFLKEVAEQSGVSLRQLNRIRANAHGPERGTLEKLSKALPEVYSIAREGATTQRVSWNFVALWQSLFPPNSTITILSGFEPPKALDEDSPEQSSVAKQLAINLFEKDIKYIFVYPKISHEVVEFLNQTRHEGETIGDDFVKHWIDRLRNNIFAKGIERYGAGWSGKELAAKRDQAWENIRLLYTDSNTISTLMWSMAPRYLVLVNLFAPEGSEYQNTQYGVFWERGQLPTIETANLSDEIRRANIITGWIFLPEDQYVIYQNMLTSVHLLNERGEGFDFKSEFPKPGNHAATRSPAQSRRSEQ